MAGLNQNPFGDPVNNPFSDPSVQQAARVHQTVDDNAFNPFAAEEATRRPAQQIRGATNPPVESPPPAYSATAGNAPTHEQLLRQQEELERKAQEIRRREEELNRLGTGNARQQNWPPLPTWCPVQPCFYQDITVEIPTEFQRMVRYGYYLWLLYVAVLFVNVLASLGFFIKSGGGLVFGVSILQLVLFTPCAFILWFRPLYKAFRSDSSVNFMVFFFVMCIQLVFITVQAIGLESFGTCGWINTMKEFGAGASHLAIAIVMLVVAIGFTFCGVGMLLLLFRVHRLYRSSGASVARAQQEFSQGVISNQHVQQAAAGVATAAVRSQFAGQQSGNPPRF